MTIDSQHLQIFLDIATEAVLAGGTILQDYLGKLDHVEEKGRPGDLVTIADKTAEAAVLEVLQSCPTEISPAPNSHQTAHRQHRLNPLLPSHYAARLE